MCPSACAQAGDLGAVLLAGVIGTSARALPATRRVARAELQGADATTAGMTGSVQLTQADDDSLPVQIDITVQNLPVGAYAMVSRQQATRVRGRRSAHAECTCAGRTVQCTQCSAHSAVRSPSAVHARCLQQQPQLR